MLCLKTGFHFVVSFMVYAFFQLSSIGCINYNTVENVFRFEFRWRNNA